MKFYNDILDKVKFDRPFYFANCVELLNEGIPILPQALKYIIQFKTPDTYTTVITGFSFGFLNSVSVGYEMLYEYANYQFVFLIDKNQNIFNSGGKLLTGKTIGDLSNYSDNETFIEISANKEVILAVKDLAFPSALFGENVIAYATIKGYFMTLRKKGEI